VKISQKVLGGGYFFLTHTVYIGTPTEVTYRVQQSLQHLTATYITRLIAATCCSDSVFGRAISYTATVHENAAVVYTRHESIQHISIIAIISSYQSATIVRY